MKRLYTVMLSLFICVTLLPICKAHALESKDLGVPQDIVLSATDVEESDRYNAFYVEMKAPKSLLSTAKGYTLWLDVRLRLVGAGQWTELTQFYNINSTDISTCLFFIRPGGVDQFELTQPSIYNAIKPALIPFKVWTGEDCLCFDRDHYSLEVQFRFSAEKDYSDAILGAWSDSVQYGKATIKIEQPTVLTGDVDVEKLSCDALSKDEFSLEFTAKIADSILRYQNSEVGTLVIKAEADFTGYGNWIEVLNADARYYDLSKPIKLNLKLSELSKKSDENSIISYPESTEEFIDDMSVRLRCEWFNYNDMENAVCITDWSEISLLSKENNEASSGGDITEAPSTNNILKIVIILLFAAVVVVVIIVLRARLVKNKQMKESEIALAKSKNNAKAKNSVKDKKSAESSRALDDFDAINEIFSDEGDNK